MTTAGGGAVRGRAVSIYSGKATLSIEKKDKILNLYERSIYRAYIFLIENVGLLEYIYTIQATCVADHIRVPVRTRAAAERRVV